MINEETFEALKQMIENSINEKVHVLMNEGHKLLESRQGTDCISEVGFNDIPQAVRDWIQEIGWEREDIISYHAKFGDLIEVTINGIYGKCFALFIKFDNGDWQKVLE